jgi:hypothetical protein
MAVSVRTWHVPDPQNPDSADDFRPHLGETFTIQDQPEPHELVLVDVEAGRHQPGAPREHPFTLTFTGQPDVPLPQAIYRLVTGTGGTVELFLVPRQPGADGLPRYDATFN